MKDQLRRKLVEIRKHHKNSREDSLSIYRQFLSLPGILSYRTYMLYYPHKNEVDTIPIIQMLQKEGKLVLLPKVEGRQIVPILLSNLSELHTGYAGIKEPEGDVYTGEIDVIVLPGVAFDEKGYRLGYGKGFYDRFLAKRKGCLKVGLAYDFQVLKELPVQQHDLPVDIVLTPTRIIRRKEEER